MKIHIPEFKAMAKCNEHMNHGPIDIDLGNDVVEVVRCKKCVLHGNCLTEDHFNFARIENPFCCAGKRKEGADNGK